MAPNTTRTGSAHPLKAKAPTRPGFNQITSSFNEEDSDMTVKITQRKTTPTGTVILTSGSTTKLQGFGLSNFQKNAIKNKQTIIKS